MEKGGVGEMKTQQVKDSPTGMIDHVDQWNVGPLLSILLLVLVVLRIMVGS